MLCPSCHAQNRENARFCKGCGHLLVVETVITDTPQSASATVPVKTPPDKTVPAWPAFVSTPASVPSMPQAVPLWEEPTLFLQPQPYPQSTQQGQPAKHGQAQDIAPTEYADSAVDENDLSLAPTQILTPDEIREYRSRLQEQEVPHEQEKQHMLN